MISDTNSQQNESNNNPHNDIWSLLRLTAAKHDHPPVKNANAVHKDNLSALDRFAIKITDKVGSMGFFLIILTWTLLWCGYNILATEVKALHWPAFDAFPAFVAYLLMSNVIQILLMPLIMVGQNLQGRHAEIRAELDFEINKKAEQEVMIVLKHIEHNTDLLIQLMKHLECRIDDEVLRAINAENQLAAKLENMKPEDLMQEYSDTD